METILDQLYEQPEHYSDVLGLLGIVALSHEDFDALFDYDYREYLNDLIRDHIKACGGFFKLSEYGCNVLHLDV